MPRFLSNLCNAFREDGMICALTATYLDGPAVCDWHRDYFRDSKECMVPACGCDGDWHE